MELFFSDNIIGGSSSVELDREESRHCIKVLRHKPGDIINVIDGSGSLFKCSILSSAQKETNQNANHCKPDKDLFSKKGKHEETDRISRKSKQSRNNSSEDCVCCTIEEVIPSFGSHSYRLTMAVAPTKNMDRYEWFLEKGTETGLNEIVPVICEHSERKDINTERCRRILVSAIKQSLKGALPVLQEPVKFTDWLNATFPLGNSSTPAGYHNQDLPEAGTEKALSSALGKPVADLRLICYCGNEFPKQSITEVLTDFFRRNDSEDKNVNHTSETTPKASLEYSSDSISEDIEKSNGMESTSFVTNDKKITIIIGPEGDFSQEEIECAIKHGFKAITLGPSRLRVESAALLSVNAVYLQSL